MHTTFNIAYCLLSGEREGCFSWVLNTIQSLLTEYEIALPQVIISDYDKAFKKACRAIFNDGIQHQICLWHVMKNVAFNTKKKWDGSLEGTALGERGSDGSHLREPEEGDNFDINPANYDSSARLIGVRLLNKDDRAQHLSQGIRNPYAHPTTNGHAPRGSDRKWIDNADGFLCAWAAVVYAGTEEQFFEEWEVLKNEFRHQPGTFVYQTPEMIFLTVF